MSVLLLIIELASSMLFIFSSHSTAGSLCFDISHDELIHYWDNIGRQQQLLLTVHSCLSA